jgi:hypothetical protein
LQGNPGDDSLVPGKDGIPGNPGPFGYPGIPGFKGLPGERGDSISDGEAWKFKVYILYRTCN